jgi:hypothetical protein
MYRYFVGPRPGLNGDRVLLRFDSEPYTDPAARGATYIVLGDTRWFPDRGGFLAMLVRETDAFREISAGEVSRVVLRLTVEALRAFGPR